METAGFLPDGGKLGALIRAFDWSSTPLGPLGSWPQSLRTAVGLMLQLRQPAYIAWGPEQISLYNDGYIPICGAKHPQGLGLPARDLWAEIWGQLGPINDAVMRGEAQWFEDMPFALAGRGGDEPSYFSFSYTPLRDERGEVAGIFCAAMETTDKVLTRRALDQVAQRWRRIFEQAPSFICILRGPDHIFEFVNSAHRRLFGSEAWVGRPIRDAFPDLEGQGFYEQLDRVYGLGERVVFVDQPVRFRSPSDGRDEVRYLDFIYAPLLDEDGSVGGVFCEGFDVSERRDAQAALRRSEEQLRLATDAAEIGLWDVDVVTDTLYWPPRVKAMFGVSPDRPVSMTDFYEGLHPDERAEVVAAFAAACDPARRTLYDVEYRTVGKEDGAIRWVAAKGRAVFDEQDRCVRVIGTAIDITGRKAAESRLRELNETLERRISEAVAERKLLADMVDGADVFVQVADPEFRFLAINRASADEFERIFGVRPKVGDSMLELLADQPESQAAVRRVWARALAGEAFTEIGEFGDAARDRRHYEMKFDVLRDSAGERVGAYQFVYDITERLRDQQRLAVTEEALRQSQKLDAMGQLTGGVAHDFNNLLTPIIGGLDMLQRGGVGGAREQRMITAALQSAERAKTLVQRLLAFARRQPLQPTAVDVGRLVAGMADLVASTSGPQIRVVVEAPPGLPPALADANQLEMAILNLSVNARDAMEHGGVLRITASAETVDAEHPAKLRPGAYVRISIADTGEGMEEAVLARAIEPFFSTKGVGKGTGLGLSMVHGLASQLGGGLTLASTPGVGTNVELWLPESVAAPRPEVQGDGPVAGGPMLGTALVVDDEDLVRLSTADMLADMGFVVVEARSAEDALRQLEAGLQINLLVTDHLMPGMTGVELAYAVRERRPEVRTLIVSGFAEAAGLAPDLNRLTKPFRQADLAAVLSATPDPGRSPR